jgi:hypothetical protein
MRLESPETRTLLFDTFWPTIWLAIENTLSRGKFRDPKPFETLVSLMLLTVVEPGSDRILF